MAVATRARPRTARAVWLQRPGVLGWLTTVDHKRIGLLYFWTTLVFFAAGGIEAMLMRTQLAQADEHVVGPETFDQLLTMHGVTMIFFFIIPMTTGAFGNYLVPLMIGARDMAFPRLNALSLLALPRRRAASSTRASSSTRRRTPAGSTTSRSR